MKIKDIKVTVCCPGRNFLTVKILTESGVHGIGDATVNGRELAVKTYLEEHVVPCLIGRDASHIEDIWHYLYRGAYWRRGPITMAAIAGIDTALWDIKAKAAGLPLYQMLGGPSRTKILAYRHASGMTMDEAVAAVATVKDDGYRAIRVQCGIPGLPPIYGTDGTSTNAAVSLPVEECWSTSKYLKIVPKLFEKTRSVFGEDLELLHDVHHRLTPIEAARLGKSLEPYSLFFLEDSTPAETQEHFRVIRQHTTTPLAVGEVFNTIWDSRVLLEENLIDYIRSTCVHAGGPTHLRRIADLAGLHQIRTAFHGAMDMSPVCFAANLHIDLWVPNFGIQEYTPYTKETLEVFKGHWSYDGDGYLHPGDAPGHGVDFDEKLAAKFPYERSYLPVNRLLDGTLWHW